MIDKSIDVLVREILGAGASVQYAGTATSRATVATSHVLTGALVWLATRLMTNPMTRNDGPLSVQRAFTADELRVMADSAGWNDAALYLEPWFRMSLVAVWEP